MALSTHTAKSLIVPVTVVALGIAAGFSMTKAAQQQLSRPPLEITVTEGEDARGVVSLSVRNGGPKTIEEWAVSTVLPDGTILTRGEREPPDKLFRSGETRALRIAANGSREFRVAAIFEDLTADGDEAILRRFFAIRENRRAQLETLVERLRSSLTSTNPRQDFQPQLSLLDQDGTDGVVKFHLQNAKAALTRTASSRSVQLEAIGEILSDCERDLAKAKTAAVRRR
jgi:hypothetical protein